MSATTGNLTERQAQWFASVREGLERETGRSLEDWVAIAKTCPETAPRARLKWLKDTHGLGQNRASYVFGTAFPSPIGWDEPKAQREALWVDPAATAILVALEDAMTGFADVVPTQRKGYSAFSRKVQFAAIRPVKNGQALLGLAVPPETDARLVSAKANEGWSERLKAKLTLTAPSDIDTGLIDLLKAAWEKA
jgi:hypothetical protein